MALDELDRVRDLVHAYTWCNSTSRIENGLKFSPLNRNSKDIVQVSSQVRQIELHFVHLKLTLQSIHQTTPPFPFLRKVLLKWLRAPRKQRSRSYTEVGTQPLTSALSSSSWIEQDIRPCPTQQPPTSNHWLTLGLPTPTSQHWIDITYQITIVTPFIYSSGNHSGMDLCSCRSWVFI